MRTVTSVFALAAAACLATPAVAQEAAPAAQETAAPTALDDAASAAAPEAEAATTDAAPAEAEATAPDAEAAAAAPAAETEVSQSVADAHAGTDPFEGFNRSMYSANEAIDNAVLEPGARGYRAVTNAPIRSGVRNFLRNLRAPVIFVNDVLQGEPKRAGETVGRFALNTTVGFFGVFDVAERAGLERHDEDFGQTLAVWGVPPGPYIFVPLFGPSNLRDGAGRIIDLAFSPFTWAEFEGDDAFNVTRTFVGAVSTREELIETLDDVRATSIDPYTTIRNSYALTRESAIRNGLQDVQDLPDFDTTFDSPETTSAEPPAAVSEPVAPSAVGVGEKGMPQ